MAKQRRGLDRNNVLQHLEIPEVENKSNNIKKSMEKIKKALNSVGQNTYAATILRISKYDMSLVVRKRVFGVSDHVRHRPGCVIT